MKIKQFAVVALFGMSVSTAQATIQAPTLEFDSSFFGDFSTQEFRFNVLSDSAISMWSNTLTDGLDNHLTLFMHNQATGAYDYVAALGNANEPRNPLTGFNTTGLNDFGVAIKNGYIPNDINHLGVSDEGNTLSLTQGSYLLVNSSEWYHSLAQDGLGSTGTYSDGYFDVPDFLGLAGDPSIPRWSEFPFGNKNQPQAFKVFVDGDVAAMSAVPLPGAVWLFASAVAGLGAVSRRKQAVVAA